MIPETMDKIGRFLQKAIFVAIAIIGVATVEFAYHFFLEPSSIDQYLPTIIGALIACNIKSSFDAPHPIANGIEPFVCVSIALSTNAILFYRLDLFSFLVFIIDISIALIIGTAFSYFRRSPQR